MSFPLVRHRRLRMTAAMRHLVSETSVSANDLIYPLFVTHGHNVKTEITSLPGVYHYSLDRLEAEILEAQQVGIQAVLLFGIPASKDEFGSSAYDDQGIVQEATRTIKRIASDMLVITDTCLCQFTDHGHCGVIQQQTDGQVTIDNDASLKRLVKTAISQAKAGADVIAPSNMMDGFVHAIRHGLDDAGLNHIPILSYTVKYASAFYGPFREAAHSTPQFGDRKTYQMDPANVREAIREATSDVHEGADMLMVKPALAYLDIIKELKEQFSLPIAAYNVSAEYAMIKAAAEKGWVDEKAVVLEMLTSMKRAGADVILTYFAKDAARWLS